VGRFELAHEGTLFLDEVSEMSPSLQVKLLRVLQEQCFERVGGTRSLQVDVRILAATNRDLEQAMARGEFREDLYYRLSVIPLTIPPLRQRKQDIPLLLGHFLDQFNGLHHVHVAGLSPRVLDILLNYSWPGNVRELENFVERLVVLKGDGVIQPEDLPEKMGGTCTTGPTVPMLEISAAGFRLDEAVTEYEQALIAIALPKANGVKHAAGFRLDEAVTEYEQTLIAIALQKANGVKHKAAQLLGMKRTTLIEKLKRYRSSAKVTL
jgi:transcriptional regulator with PAS, ATPase and Fis domain